MTQKTAIIDQLADDLTPVKALANMTLVYICAAALILTGIFILLPQGVRPDLLAVLENGTLTWKSGSFILLAGALFMQILYLTRPVKKHCYLSIAFTLSAAALLIFQMFAQYDTSNFWGYAFDYLDHATGCFASIIFGGLAVLALIWFGWLKRSAPAFPKLLGFASGTLSGAIAAMMYSLHCPHDNIIYVGLYYGTSILVTGLIGAWAGQRFLKW